MQMLFYEQNKVLQGHSKYPVLIAVNTEAGGDGAANDGAYIGHEVKIAATNDSKYAYEMAVYLVLTQVIHSLALKILVTLLLTYTLTVLT